MTREEGDTAAPGIETELNRDIGIWGAIAIGVGTMIAAGIFVLSGLAVSNVGTMAIVSFLIAAVVAGFTAAAYAEFASIYPESGGGYAYVSNTFDSDLTYIVGWSMILGYPASAAFYLASFSDWFTRFMVPAMSLPAAIPYWSWGAVVLALLVAVNIKGTEETGLFQIVVTALKVALIVLFLYGGLQAFDADVVATSFVEHAGSYGEIALTSALVFITFFGFEAIATNAEEIEEPGKNVPRAIFISMVVVTIIYTLVVLVVVLAVNDPAFLTFLAEKAGLAGPEAAEAFVAENGEVSMGRAAQFYLGDWGFYVIIVGALFSMVSAANATIMAGSRVKLAMARRDHLPTRFEELHDRFETPWRAVLLTGGFILFFILLFSVIFGEVPGAVEEVHNPLGLHLGVEGIAHFADFMLLTGLVFVNWAVIESRKRHPDIERQFEVPLVPWVPILAILANLVLLVNVDRSSFLMGLLAQAIGIGYWFTWKSQPRPLEEIEAETPTLLAEHAAPIHSDRYQVLVPVANPAHAEQLVRTGADIALERDGEVHVLSIVTIPEQTPLSRGRQYVDEHRAIVERARDVAEYMGVDVSASIRIGHHASDAILNTIEHNGSDAVLLGWHGRKHRRRDIVLGTTVDQVVQEADCDVLVERITEPRGNIRSILVPTAGGPHAELASEIASALARSEEATVHVVRVLPPDAPATARQQAEAALDRVLEHFDDDTRVQVDIVEGEDVADTLVDLTGEHDLTVLGATREGFFKKIVFGAIPEAVADRAQGNVLMVRRNLPVTGLIRRWFQRF